MVGHDAPGFHQVIDAVVAPPEPETDWFARWRATDIYCKQLETRIARASFNNEGLARQCISLLEQVRDLNRELRRLHREREGRCVVSDDIVTRLQMFSLDDGTDALNKLLTEAADEIERLREQNEYLKANVEMLLAEARAVRGE